MCELTSAVSRRPVGDLLKFGSFGLPRGVSRLAVRSFPLTRGLSLRTRHCQRSAGARHVWTSLYFLHSWTISPRIIPQASVLCDTFLCFSVTVELILIHFSWTSCLHRLAGCIAPNTCLRASLCVSVILYANLQVCSSSLQDGKKSQQDRQCTYNVTLMCVRVTTVAVEKQYYIFLCICV